MSPVICAGALASIKYLKDHNELRERHQERAIKLKKDLTEVGIEVLNCASTHIVPVMVRDPKKCKLMSDMLLDDYNIYIQPINYPTVQRGTERLRIAPTPLHTDAMMHDLVEALRKTFKRTKG
jgi:5-aminolevulinate synthase